MQTRRHFVQVGQSYSSSSDDDVSKTTSLITNLGSPLSPSSVVQDLKSMTRANLLNIFSNSHTPLSLSEIEGEWDGCLLDNNGFVMTTVSNIMTHGLFGLGRRWNGKKFGADGKGSNRFNIKSSQSDNSDNSGVTTAHNFDFSITDSAVDVRQGSSSVVQLVYSNYHPRLSLWKTMADEVRFIPAGDKQVLIGLGSMKWSGGMLNAAPFCLWRANPKTINI